MSLLIGLACSNLSRDSSGRPIDPPDTADAAPYVAGMRGMTGPDSMVRMSAMPRMTGDPDHDFLRMLSDRHAGMIVLARDAVGDARGSREMRSDGVRIADEEGKALETMSRRLVVEYRDAYEPNSESTPRVVRDSLRGLDARIDDREFYREIVVYRRETIRIIDQFLERGRRADLISMALALKSQEVRRIAEAERPTVRP